MFVDAIRLDDISLFNPWLIIITNFWQNRITIWSLGVIYLIKRFDFSHEIIRMTMILINHSCFFPTVATLPPPLSLQWRIYHLNIFYLNGISINDGIIYFSNVIQIWITYIKCVGVKWLSVLSLWLVSCIVYDHVGFFFIVTVSLSPLLSIPLYGAQFN